MQQQSSFKMTDYLLAPHEWLRIAAFKLIGKRYRYHWEEHRIVSAEELTTSQQLLCLLSPVVMGTVIALLIVTAWVFSFAWVELPIRLPDYLWHAPLWHHLLHLTWIALLAYTFLFSCNDVIFAYRLLRQQRHYK